MKLLKLGLIAAAFAFVAAHSTQAQGVAFTDAVFSGDFKDVGIAVVITPLSKENLEYCWKTKDGNKGCPVYNYKQRGKNVTFQQKDFGKWALDITTGELKFSNNGGNSFFASLKARRK